MKFRSWFLSDKWTIQIRLVSSKWQFRSLEANLVTQMRPGSLTVCGQYDKSLTSKGIPAPNARPPSVPKSSLCREKLRSSPVEDELPMELQIEWTKAESQPIVITRWLCGLQYPVQSLSRLQRIYSQPAVNIRCKAKPRRATCYGLRRKPIGTPTGMVERKSCVLVGFPA